MGGLQSWATSTTLVLSALGDCFQSYAIRILSLVHVGSLPAICTWSLSYSTLSTPGAKGGRRNVPFHRISSSAGPWEIISGPRIEAASSSGPCIRGWHPGLMVHTSDEWLARSQMNAGWPHGFRIPSSESKGIVCMVISPVRPSVIQSHRRTLAQSTL